MVARIGRDFDPGAFDLKKAGAAEKDYKSMRAEMPKTQRYGRGPAGSTHRFAGIADLPMSNARSEDKERSP